MAYNTAYLDELVAEYLTYRGFFGSLKAFKQDQKTDKTKSFNVDKIVDFLLQLVSGGDLAMLRATWSHLSSAVFSRLPDTAHATAAQRLEVALYKLYLVHAHQNNKREKINEFFQTLSPSLINNSENTAWKEWLAFPYVNQPNTQPPFAVCFTRPWQDSVAISLTNLLLVSFHLLPKPRLVILFDHISKLETDLGRVKGADGASVIAEDRARLGNIDQNSTASTEVSRASRRLLSFFTSSKTSSPATTTGIVNNNNRPSGSTANSDTFRRSKSQSSFARPSLLGNMVSSLAERLSDVPAEQGQEAEAEAENDETRANRKANMTEPELSDASAAEDGFDGHFENADGDEQNDANGGNLGGRLQSQSLPSQSCIEKVASSSATLQHKTGNVESDSSKRLSKDDVGDDGSGSEQQHRISALLSDFQLKKQSASTRFTCLDTESTQVLGCHGMATVRYSSDGRFLGVMCQLARTVFIYSADAINSRGVVAAALVSSLPSCFCLGSSQQRSSPTDDGIRQLLVAVGSTTSGTLFVFSHSDATSRSSKMSMISSQLVLVPLESGSMHKQHSVVDVDSVPSQLDLAVAVVSVAENNHKTTSSCVVPGTSQIYVASLADLTVIQRIESTFNGSSLSSCCCFPASASNVSPVSPFGNSLGRTNASWLVALGDSSGAIYQSSLSNSNNSSQVVSWNSLKLANFSKIIRLQPLAIASTDSSGKLLIGDANGRFALCRIDASSSTPTTYTITLLCKCDAFYGGLSPPTIPAPSASPDGQFAAVLHAKGSSLYLISITADGSEFSEIVAQLNGDDFNGNGGNKQSPAFTCVAWSPCVLQTAFTYIAALTADGELLVFRLLT